LRIWLSGPRIFGGLLWPGISLGREDLQRLRGRPEHLPTWRRYELSHGLQKAATARGAKLTKEDANYAIDKALATGLLDSNGNLNFHMRGTREEIIAGILTTAKAWGQLMTCDQAERIADRAIRKARWPIGNIVTIAIIAAFIAVTVLAFVLGRR
jgi:hypothetical protein